MTLALVPKGRGRWKPMVMRLEGARGPLLFAVGQVIDMAGVRWRIASIGP